MNYVFFGKINEKNGGKINKFKCFCPPKRTNAAAVGVFMYWFNKCVFIS